MIRPMTSNVATLSGVVANGHHAIHFVSSAPSKIPYGGFSPVRLQTRLTPRPSSRTLPRPLIGRHCRYLRPRRLIRNGSCDQSAPKTSDHDRESSGPWLPDRFYCPARSWLTMATSAPLSAAQWLMNYSIRLRVRPAGHRGSPIYSASPFLPCRRPYSGGPRDCARQCLHRGCRLRHFRTGSATPMSHQSGPGGLRNEAAAFALCYGLEGRLPRSGRDLYDRACVGRITPCPTSVITRWFIVNYHRRPLTGWTGSLMGCERRAQRRGRI